MNDHEGPGQHLKPEELGAYLERAQRSESAARVEDHIAKCAECREQLIALGRLVQPGASSGRLKRAYWIAPVAAAAIAVLLLLPPRAGDGGSPGEPVLRTGDTEGAVTITAVAPVASSRLHADSAVFAWNAVEDRVVYQVSLMDEDLAVIWSGSAEDTTIALPGDVTLERGARFFWYVEALLAEARSARSGVQEFFTLP